MFFFLYSRGPTVSTLPYTLSPYTKLYRSDRHQPAAQRDDIGQHAQRGAQLDVAVGAPAAAGEGDGHRAAAQQAGQGYRAAPGVGQGEIGGSLIIAQGLVEQGARPQFLDLRGVEFGPAGGCGTLPFGLEIGKFLVPCPRRSSCGGFRPGAESRPVLCFSRTNERRVG